MENILPILIADAPETLTELCGVNLLERLLRILQRLGLRRAIVFSSTPEIVGTELAKRSWAREQMTVQLVSSVMKPLTAQLLLEQAEADRFLIVPANIYCDARLLAAICTKDSSAALVDSNPPEFARNLIRNPCGPALITRDFLCALSPVTPFLNELTKKIDHAKIDVVDAAKEDDYVVSMRRHVRPLCFRAPQEQDRRLAERIILDSAQNGTLDLPAYLHAPIETAIISLLCKTRITPTKFRLEVSSSVAARPRRSWLAASASESSLLSYLALVDGLDGKQSRVKIETTERGGMGTSSRLFDRKLVVAGHCLSFVGKRPISERILFSRFAHRVAPAD
jgi:hypothetical protein